MNLASAGELAAALLLGREARVAHRDPFDLLRFPERVHSSGPNILAPGKRIYVEWHALPAPAFDAEAVLVDENAEALDVMSRVAARVKIASGTDIIIESATDRRLMAEDIAVIKSQVSDLRSASKRGR